METANFKHTGNIGDCVSAIPAMRQFTKKTGKKINLYLEKDIPAHYYDNSDHPTKNSKNEHVMLNEQIIQMMKPLFRAQSFINDVFVYNDEKIDVDLSLFRETFIGLPNFSINRWYFYVYPDLTCDLSGVWLDVPDANENFAKERIMITRSERYTNPNLDYSFLKPYEDELMFCGTMREYNNFCMQFDLNIEKFHIDNFLQLAQAIKQCKFHITNQTQAFQLSEGQKIPRMLEVCYFAANCIPIGDKAYDYQAQYGLEYDFHALYGDEKKYLEQLKSRQLKTA